MRNGASSEVSLLGLIRHFRDEIKTLIHEEIALAKAELSEKISRFGHNAVFLAAGAVAAFAGLIILLASLSSLIAFGFEQLGMARSLAFFLGALIIGGGVALLGFGFVAKAAKTFSKESIAPEKTIETLKKLKPAGAEAAAHPSAPHAPEDKRSSKEIEASVEMTRKEAGETAERITERLTPRHLGHVVSQKIQEHPVRTGLIGAGTGALGWWIVHRRRQHAH
jgi:hypothetical protein